MELAVGLDVGRVEGSISPPGIHEHLLAGGPDCISSSAIASPLRLKGVHGVIHELGAYRPVERVLPHPPVGAIERHGDIGAKVQALGPFVE